MSIYPSSLTTIQFKTSLCLIVFLIFISSPVFAIDKSLQRTSQAIQSFQTMSKGSVSVTRAPNSPYVSFIKAHPKEPILDTSVSTLPLDRARHFLQNQKAAFIDSKTNLELIETKSTLGDDQDTVRMQQMYNGIPVRGGEVVIKMNALGITTVNSKLLSDINGINIKPTVSAAVALSEAKNIILELYGVSNVSFSIPQLEIINDGVFKSALAVPKLAWFVEAKGLTLREFIWVNADNGTLIKNISQFARIIGKDRETFDVIGACNFDGINTPVLTEVITTYGVATVQAAHDLAGLSYDYYFNILGREGLNGNTVPPIRTIASMANICNAFSAFVPPTGLTLELAGWNGLQMLYALDNTVDDIVGHEYTHAVIEETANFMLQRESGALAESFADIIGETIDLANTTAFDNAGDVRWDIGENSPTGPFRNLLTPSNISNASGIAFPEKVTDPNFYCGTDNDIYIHKNSTVLSHAFAFAVDGGTFNNVMIPAIDTVALDKVAKVYYTALTTLTSMSLFIDAYDAIVAATNNSVDITTGEKATIINALNAVEMYIPPCAPAQIPYCPVGLSAQFLFRDDFENINSGNWITTTVSGVNHWNAGAGTIPEDVYQSGNDLFAFLPIARQGTYALYANTTRDMGSPGTQTGESVVAMTKSVFVAGNTQLQFEHNFSFESSNTDGGRIEYSLDSSGVWLDAGPLISSGAAYNGRIDQFGQGNPMTGLTGFVGFMLDDGAIPASPVYTYSSTQLDLSTLSGSNVSFRYRVGTDSNGAARGWVIDEVGIYSCQTEVIKIVQGTALTTTEAGKLALFDVTLSSQPTADVTISLLSSNIAEGIVTSPASKSLTFTSTNWSMPQTVFVTGQDDSLVDGDIAYVINLTGSAADPVNDSIFDGVQAAVNITNIDDGESSGGGGGGGCSLSTKDKFDPMLPLLLLLSIVFLFIRKKSSNHNIH